MRSATRPASLFLLATLIFACEPAATAPPAASVAIATAAAPTAAPQTAAPTLPPTPTPLPTPAESVADFWTRKLQAEGRGDWGPTWDALHPAQQTLMTRDRYITCSNANKLTGAVVMKILGTREEMFGPAEVGVQPPALTTAVTINMSIAGEPAETFTVHTWNIAGRWRWALDQASYEAFKKGACPD